MTFMLMPRVLALLLLAIPMTLLQIPIALIVVCFGSRLPFAISLLAGVKSIILNNLLIRTNIRSKIDK